MRLELSNFKYAYQTAEVTSISDGVIGPAEAKRMLGPQLADTLPVQGSVVVVKGRLPSKTFTSDDKEYEYHDGMGGTAEIALKNETILEMMLPALKEL